MAEEAKKEEVKKDTVIATGLARYNFEYAKRKYNFDFELNCSIEEVFSAISFLHREVLKAVNLEQAKRDKALEQAKAQKSLPVTDIAKELPKEAK